MNSQLKNLDYCGIVILLRQLIDEGGCTEAEARRVAQRIAAQNDVDIIIDL